MLTFYIYPITVDIHTIKRECLLLSKRLIIFIFESKSETLCRWNLSFQFEIFDE